MPAATLTPSTRPDVRAPHHLRLAGLSVVLPCLDEAENIAQAIDEALTAAARCADAVEVIVVDDGSRDATGSIAAAIGHRDPRVRLVTHEVNRGYGAAVRSGIAASSMPWVLLTDADLQFDLAELADLLPLTPDHDIVAGFRIARQDPAHRRAAAHAWNALMRHSFKIAVRDVDCAFKLVRGPELRALELRSDGAMISSELYARAAAAGFAVAEAGVHHRPRLAGEPTGGDARVIVRAFRERRELRRALRPQPAAAARRARIAVPRRARLGL